MDPADSNTEANKRLDTWKEIGAFFSRDERTVKRWETTRGLPVHRVPGAGRPNVYANTDELAEWLKGKNAAAERNPGSNFGAPSTVGTAPGRESGPGADMDATSIDCGLGTQPGAVRAPQSSSLGVRWGPARYLTIALAILAMAFVIVAVVRRSHSARAAGTNAATLPRHTVDPEAEQLYLKGMYYWNKRTPEALHQAVDYFTQAVVRDPGYARAYVGLADCYNLLREYSLMPPQEAYPRAMAATKRAIAIDDSISEAHSSLAFVDFYWSWDVAGAEREFGRALALDPNSVIAHHWYATFLMQIGRFPESLQEIEKAQELDPRSTPILADKGLILFYSGRPEPGVDLLKQLEATEPDFLSLHNYLAFIYLAQGDGRQYLVEARKAATLLHDQQRLAIVAAGEKGFARAGTRGMLIAILSEQQSQHATGQVPDYDLGQTCALLGKKPEALDDLQAAYSKHAPELVRLRIDPTISALHDEPRFRELLAQVGLPALP